MKKDKGPQSKSDELRPEYKAADFPAKMERGKYSKGVNEASNSKKINIHGNPQVNMSASHTSPGGQDMT